MVVASHEGKLRFLSLLLLLLALAGCAKYHPRPLDPRRLQDQYRSRTLVDEGLRAYLEASDVKPQSWPQAKWNMAQLAVAAYYFNPQLAVARARYESARSAVLTAQGRPNPSISLGAGWTNSPESPLVLSFEPAITLETAGKRGYRILEAERQAEVARLEATEAAWKVRSAVRAALLDHWMALRELDLLSAEEQLRAVSVRILDRRLAVGEIGRPEVDVVRTELGAVQVAAKQSQGQVAETKAALAALIGIPEAAVNGVELEWKEFDTPPALADLPLEAVQRTGLLNRPDVRRSLAEYAVAEATLQLEVARQYPDITIGPGYGFDEGHHKFTLGPSLSIPVINRNRGPIAQAEAKRDEAAKEFLAIQAQAMAEIEKTREAYANALKELAAADQQLNFVRKTREPAVLRALTAGESDQAGLNDVRLEGVVAQRVRLGSLRRAQAALGALEEATAAGLVPEMQTPQKGRP